MKNFTKFFMLAAFVMAFAACSNDATEDVLPVNPEVGTKTITVTLDTEMTRTTLTDDHKGLQWETGDSFGYFANGTNAAANTKVTYDGAATYTLNVPNDATEVYAYYPHYTNDKGANSAADAITLGMNAQNQTAGGVFHGKDYPMAAKATIDADGKANLVFKPVACAIAFNVYNTDESYAGGETVNEIKLVAEKSCGYAAYDLTTGAFTADPSYNDITLTVGDVEVGTAKPENTQADANQIYLMLHKGSYTNATITVTTSANNTYTFSGANLDCTNDMLAMNLNLSKGSSIDFASLTEDKIVAADLVATTTTYKTFSNVNKPSGAVYCGQSANNNNAIQIRTTNSNSGIVTTTTGGKLKKVSVKWASTTTTTRTIDIYGSDTPYASASDLYNSDAQGTYLGSIVYGTSTEWVGDTNYKYVGLRSKKDALAVSYVSIYWAKDTDPYITASNVTATAGETAGEVTYTIANSTETDVTATCDGTVVTDVVAEGGSILYELAPNYTTTEREGWITLSLTNNASVTKTIKVTQTGSTFEVPETVTIASDKTSATFTVNSSDFGWSITNFDGDFVDITPTEGESGETEVTVTSNATTAGDIGWIEFCRTGAVESVKVTIKKADAGAVEKTTEFTFSSLYDNAEEVTTVTNTGEPITLVFGKNGGSNPPKYYTNEGTAVRMYLKNSLNINSAGATITKVVITYTASKYSSNWSTKPSGYNLTDTTGTWTGNTTSLDFVVNTSGDQVRIVSIAVTYIAE